jgi:hypothetical protein
MNEQNNQKLDSTPDLSGKNIKEDHIEATPVSSQKHQELELASEARSGLFFKKLIIIFGIAAVLGFGLWIFRNFVLVDRADDSPAISDVEEVQVVEDSGTQEQTTPISDLEDDLDALEGEIDAFEEDIEANLNLDIEVPTY